MKYEYCLKTWGGFYNEQHQKKHGHKEGYFWFDTAEARENYIKLLQTIENDLHAYGLGVAKTEGTETRFKTVAKMIFVFKGKEYPYETDFGYGYALDSAEFMFYEGNFACDCNRSMFIGLPEMQCGNRIKMKDFVVIKVKGTDEQFDVVNP